MKSGELIGQDHFPNISQERDFSWTRSLRGKIDNNKKLCFRPFPATTKESILRKCPKTLFWTHFRPKPLNWLRTGFLLKIRALSLFLHLLTPTKYQKKTNEPIPRKRLSDERTMRGGQ